MDKAKKRVWTYARVVDDYRGTMAQHGYLLARIRVEDGCQLVGYSVDTRHPVHQRKGLKELRVAVRKEKMDEIWVTNLGAISRRPRVAYRVLKELQSHHIAIHSINSNLEYELNVMGLDKKMLKRSFKKDGFIPWKRGEPIQIIGIVDENDLLREG